jgi:hypothetical protein
MNVFVLLFTVMLIFGSGSVLADYNFDKEKDLFIAQFDNLPDSDDMHAQAAIASMLAHPDFKGVNYFCVAGTWGAQSVHERYKYNNSNSLFALGFGVEAKRDTSEAQRTNAQWESARWVDAHGRMVHGKKNMLVNPQSQERLKQLDFASDVVAFKARRILENGGRVFVMEAGQSDLSADWIRKLHAKSVPNVKTHVIIVQHSLFNERFTSGHRFTFADDAAKGLNDWEYVTNGKNNQYIKIPDGNSAGNGTPDFALEDISFQIEALSDKNPNKHSRKIWLETKRLVDLSPYTNGVIPKGGTDFSDVVEAIWIFDLLEEVSDLRRFWDKFVVNKPSEG